MFGVFLAVFLSFSRVFIGIERGEKSLVFWVVFLGVYLNTKEWKIREGARRERGVPFLSSTEISSVGGDWPELCTCSCRLPFR